MFFTVLSRCFLGGFPCLLWFGLCFPLLSIVLACSLFCLTFHCFGYYVGSSPPCFVYGFGFFCRVFVDGVGIVLYLVASNSYYLLEANSKDAIISDAFCLPEITEKK